MITPNWQPLELFHIKKPNLFDMEDFMWICSSNAIECYKHQMTRAYVNIDDNGLFWHYLDGEYHEIPEDIVLEVLREARFMCHDGQY